MKPSSFSIYRSTLRLLLQDVVSPAQGSGSALERAQNVLRDPTTVEGSFLGPDPLTVYRAGIHALGVESDMILDRGVGRARFGISPGGSLRYLIANRDRVVQGLSLSLAERGFGLTLEKLHTDILRRDVVYGRKARLQRPQHPAGFGDDFPPNSTRILLRLVSIFGGRG